jgi:hypothetical protein
LSRYENGLQYRNPNAAYIHRQDYYLSRLASTRLLRDYLKPDGPGPLTDDAKHEIRALLGKKPEAVTDDWLRSTERATGRIKLRGNQRAELVRQAAEYLERTNRAWRASEALRHSARPVGDVEPRRERLLITLPGVRDQARGTPWGALFAQLTEGLVP